MLYAGAHLTNFLTARVALGCTWHACAFTSFIGHVQIFNFHTLDGSMAVFTENTVDIQECGARVSSYIISLVIQAWKQNFED